MRSITNIFQALLGMVAVVFNCFIAIGRLVMRKCRSCWVESPKWVRCVVLSVVLLLGVGLVSLIGLGYYLDNYGRDYYDSYVSDTVTLRSFADDRWRLYNDVTEKYITGKINWVSDTSKDAPYAVYAVPHRRGYINTESGEVVIDATKNRYTRAWLFSEGLAAVECDGKIGFINDKNEVVIPFKFDYPDGVDMYDLAPIFHNGYALMCSVDGKLGLVDKEGNWAIEPEYDQIWAPQECGYRTVIKGDKYGLLDASLNIVYDVAYDYVGQYTESDSFVLMNEGRMWQEDREGRVLNAFMYEYSEVLCYPMGVEDYDEWECSYVGELSAYAKYQVSGLYGIMNRFTGEPITLAIYDDIEMVSPTLFEVSRDDAYGCFLIDTKGNVVNR
ncbi:MAG: WG repeat-containing protein [Alistipes sp.]|nr:WG repeat-containing protein [Alistipes sp.]